MRSSTPNSTLSTFRLTSQRMQRSVRGATVLFVAATFVSAAQQGAPPGSPDRPYLLPEANHLPDKNDQMKMLEGQQAQTQSYAAANLERQKQIADDAAKLLALATELKKEVDKTGKDTLSLNVIRKAESIERLAKGVKEKMKLSAGAS